MSEIQWFIQVSPGKKAGPVSFEKLQQLAQSNRIFSDTKLRSTEEGAAWTLAGELPGLFDQKVSGNETEDRAEPDAVSETLDDSGTSGEIAPEKSQDDGQAKIGKIEVNPGAGKAKTSTGNKPAFIINTGKSVSKKPKDKEDKEKKQEPKATDGSAGKDKSEASSPGIKINLSGAGGKKSAAATSAKPTTKDESTSITVGLDELTGSPEKKTETNESSEKSSSVKIDPSAWKEKKRSADASSAMVRIDLGGTKMKADKASGDASKGAFSLKPSVKPEKKPRNDTEERDQNDKKIKKISKPKKEPRPKKEPKPNRAGESLPLGAAAIVAALTGIVGGGGVFGLSMKPLGVAAAGTLCGVIVLLGLILAVVAWMLAGLCNRLHMEKLQGEKPSGEKLQSDRQPDDGESDKTADRQSESNDDKE